MLLAAALMVWEPRVSAQVESQKRAQEGPESIRQSVLQNLRLRNVAVQNAIVQRSAHETSIDLRMADKEQTLHLFPVSLRSPSFRLFVQDNAGAIREIVAPPTSTYRGWLGENSNCVVAATISKDEVRAVIKAADGKFWHVQPVGAAGVSGGGKGLHAVYESSDVIGDQGVCGVTGDPVAPVRAESAGGESPQPLVVGTVGRTEIAFDADFEFYQANGSDVDRTVADIEMIMNQVGLIYQNQVDICYALTAIIVRTAEPDPYTSTDKDTLLCEFRNEWNGYWFIPRDVAHLMTGKNINGNTIGLAYFAGVCNPVVSTCGGSSGSKGYGFSESRYTTTLALRVSLTAHELGHNWNACHCDQMGCTGGGADADCGIMNSVNNGSLVFGSRAVNSITSYRSSATCLATCVNPVYVDWRNNGSQDGTLANPYKTVESGVRNALVGGQVSIYSGTYPENIPINKSATLTTRGGSIAIGQ